MLLLLLLLLADQDSLLHVFHAVVVFLEDGFRCGEVDVVDAELSPRHARQPVEVVASHTATDTQVYKLRTSSDTTPYVVYCVLKL